MVSSAVHAPLGHVAPGSLAPERPVNTHPGLQDMYGVSVRCAVKRREGRRTRRDGL
jgi:hypothetical protein